MPSETVIEIRKLTGYFYKYNAYKTYPTLANGVTLTTDDGNWTDGNYTEVIPSNTITSPFYVHSCILYHGNNTIDYEVDISYGTVGNEIIIGTVPYFSTDANNEIELIFILPIKLPANTRISAKTRCEDIVVPANAHSIDIKIRYRINLI